MIIPLLRWVVYPWFDQIPDDFKYEANIFSIDNLYDEKLRQYSGEQLSVTDFGYKVGKREGSNLVIENYFDVRKPSGERIFKVERFYGINPGSGRHVPQLGDHPREGYLFAPEKVEKGDSFYYWHVNYDTPVLLKYRSEEEIAGLRTYRFIAEFKADQTKNLGHLPGVPNERGVELDVLLEIWIDPESGWLIKYEDQATAWYYDVKSGRRLVPWNKFHNEYTQSSIFRHVDIAKNKQLITSLFLLYIPILIVFICVIFLINIFSSETIRKKYQPHYFFVLVSFTGVIISFSLYSYLNNSNKEKQDLTFEKESTKILSYVNDGLKEVQNEVSKLRMKYYQLNTKYPGYFWFKNEVNPLINQIPYLEAINYIPLVHENERIAFEEFARSQGEQNFRIHHIDQDKSVPSSGKNVYFPILYTEPHENNKQSIGFDSGSYPDRRKAFDLMKKTGEYTISDPVELFGTKPDRGVVVYLPLYEYPEENIREVNGFFAAVIGAEKLIQTARNSHDINRKILLTVRDVSGSDSSGLFSDDFEYNKDLKIITKDIPVLNRVWEFTFYLEPEKGEFTALAILIIGLLLTFTSAFLIFWMQSDNSKELAIQIEQMEKTKEFLLDAQEVGKVGSWEINYKTKEMKASAEFFKILGRERMEGFTVDDFIKYIHPDDFQSVVESIKNSIENKTSSSVEIRILNDSGQTVYVWMKGKIFYDEDGVLERFSGTISDVTDKKMVEQEMLKAKKQTEESALLKEAFLANMSHEIRTPINAIVGFTDLLLRRNIPNLEKDYLRSIKYSGENLLSIINDILDVSKIESGVMTFESIPCNLSDTFISLSKVFSSKAREKHNKLIFEIDPDIPQTVLGDPTRLSQIFNNLIGNSLKFTNNGQVSVKAELIGKEHDSLRISFYVTDSGIGIEADKLPYVFERFRQADTHITRFYGGTGLGLNISKQLIEKQGGSIQIESEVNKGTKVTFTLPFLKSEIELPSEGKEVQKIDPDSFSDRKILLVEDNPVNRKFLQSLFEEYHIQFDMAINGKEAVGKIREQKYDVVLMDLEMPEMNGFKAVQLIREELKSNVRIIALTAHSMVGEKERCLAAGMNDYLSKPIQAEILFEKMFGGIISFPKNEKESKSVKRFIDFSQVYDTANNRKDVVAGILKVFKEQLPKDMTQLNSAIQNSDYAAIIRRTHNLKSTISIIGLSEMKALIEKLEERAVNKKTSSDMYAVYLKLLKLSEKAIRLTENELKKLQLNT